jgi:hypothetical protein
VSGTPRTTLKPGDLLWWEPGPGEENAEGSALLVSDDGESLMFQFARVPWHEMAAQAMSWGERGLTVQEAEAVLRGEAEFRLPGHIYKAYDEASGRSFSDPTVEVE